MIFVEVNRNSSYRNPRMFRRLAYYESLYRCKVELQDIQESGKRTEIKASDFLFSPADTILPLFQ
jgi:hypothetical protein